MSTIPDLWPDDIRSDQVLTPEEILTEQAHALSLRTNGLLVGVVRKTEAEDRIVLGFEIESPRFESAYRMFEAQHRKDYEYPASLTPPDETLPNYLQSKVVIPGFGGVLGGRHVSNALDVLATGRVITNEWVATSPQIFKEKIADILKHPVIKARVLSLIARANKRESA